MATQKPLPALGHVVCCISQNQKQLGTTKVLFIAADDACACLLSCPEVCTESVSPFRRSCTQHQSQVANMKPGRSVGLSLERFAHAKTSTYDKKHRKEKEFALNAKKVNKYRKLKQRLAQSGRLQPNLPSLDEVCMPLFSSNQ